MSDSDTSSSSGSSTDDEEEDGNSTSSSLGSIFSSGVYLKQHFTINGIYF